MLGIVVVEVDGRDSNFIDSAKYNGSNTRRVCYQWTMTWFNYFHIYIPYASLQVCATRFVSKR